MVVIDSLSKKILDEYPFKNELFLTKLENKSISFSNMYTQGPFTEASLNGLVAGQDNLDYGSYMYSYYKCPTTIFEEFKKNGYKIYYSGIPDDFIDGFYEDKYHPVLSHIEYGRLNDFRKTLNEKGLSKEELNCCRRIVQFELCRCINYCELYLKKDKQLSMILENDGYLNLEQVKNNLKIYKELLLKLEDDNFVIEIIKNGIDKYAPTFDISIPDYNDAEFEKMFSGYRKELKKSAKHREPKPGRRKTIFIAIKRFLMHPSIMNLKLIGIAFRQQYHLVKNNIDTLLAKKCIDHIYCASFKRQVDFASEWVKNSNEKHFIFLQPQDFHSPSTFWTHDTSNINLVRQELDEAIALAKRIPKSYKCNILTFLSINYIDKQLERLYESIQDKENTVFVVTSDHGYWEYMDVIKYDTYNAMTEERLHIPCFIDLFDNNKQIIKTLHNNNCLPNTILHYAGIKETPSFKPAFYNETNNYLICENFSFGSPDINTKPIKYTIHNYHYKLIGQLYINELLNSNNNTKIQFYDLNKDKYELNNLISNGQYQKIIEEMSELVIKRHDNVVQQLKNNYYEVPNKIKNIVANYIK